MLTKTEPLPAVYTLDEAVYLKETKDSLAIYLTRFDVVPEEIECWLDSKIRYGFFVHTSVPIFLIEFVELVTITVNIDFEDENYEQYCPLPGVDIPLELSLIEIPSPILKARRHCLLKAEVMESFRTQTEKAVKRFGDDLYLEKGKRSGSFVPVLDIGEAGHLPFSVWTYGNVEISFQHYLNRPVFEDEQKRLELMSKLNLISGVDIQQEQITKRPNISLKLLTSEESKNQFFDAFDWYLKEIQNKK